MRHQLTGRPNSSRRYQADPLVVVLPYQAHRFGDVAVVGDDHRAIVGVHPAVIQQMHGEIDVRAFLLGPDHLRHVLAPKRFRKRRPDLMAEEVAEVDFHPGPIMPQGAEIHVLPLGFRRIAGRARHPCREVLDRQNIVMGLQHLLEQGEQVQPFPGRFLERPVIEIEPVDIDEGAHRFPPKKQGPPKRPRALRSKPQGVSPTI